jgi:hypothetical protein
MGSFANIRALLSSVLQHRERNTYTATVLFCISFAFAAYSQISTPVAPELYSPFNNQTDVMYMYQSLGWNESVWATWYRIQVSTDTNFSSNIADTELTANSLSTGSSVFLQPGTTYYWRVNAKNSLGISPWSVTWRFTTRFFNIGLKSPLKYETGVSLKPVLKWDSLNSSSVTYRVQVSTDSNFTAIMVSDSTVTATSKVIGPLSPNTVYYWRVSYKNNGLWSPWSQTWAFYTTAATMAESRNFPSFDPRLFCSQKAIRYILAAPSNVSIKVYDLRGKVVWHVENTSQNAGNYCLNSNYSEIGSGQYILTFRAGTYMTTRKIGAID